MEVQLIDGTLQLFRHFHALPSARDEEGREVGAVRGVFGSILGMMKAGTYLHRGGDRPRDRVFTKPAMVRRQDR